MNKSGFAMSMLGKIVLVVLLVLVVSGTLIVNIAWGGDKMTSCKAAGGEPLPINTPNRELVPNYAGIGRDLKKAQDADNSGIPYACFVADYATGRGARLNDEDIPGGYHFYLLTYPDYPAENIAINPAPSNEFAYKPKDAEEFERTLIDGHSLNLEENRLYGFQAYIKNQENKFCSIYLREGGENQGSADSNIKGGYVKRVKCDEAESAPILFYVPKKKHMSAVDYKQPIDIVLLPRKTYEGAADWDNDHAVTITVNPVVGPCNSRFQVLGADKTDVSALQEGKYQNNNPVTFTLHDNSVTAKFNNVVISPNIVINPDNPSATCLNLEKVIPYVERGVLTIDGEYLGFQSGTIDITMHDVNKHRTTAEKLYVRPQLTYKIKDEHDLWMSANDLTQNREFSSSSEKFTFSIKDAPKSKSMSFKLYPNNCDSIYKQEVCERYSGETDSEVLACYSEGSGCEACSRIEECGDYNRHACETNLCKFNDPKGCLYRDRNNWFNKCVEDGVTSGDQCADHFDGCSDYKTKEDCETDLCGGNCKWSGLFSKSCKDKT